VNKKKKFYVHLGKNHCYSRKNDCSFFISFFRSIFTGSIVLLLIIRRYLFCFYIHSWVSRCRLFHCVRVFRQVRQRGQ
jgi:hypothetical protein